MTDDSAVIQRLIDAAWERGEDEVLIPYGQYVLERTVILPGDADRPFMVNGNGASFDGSASPLFSDSEGRVLYGNTDGGETA